MSTSAERQPQRLGRRHHRYAIVTHREGETEVHSFGVDSDADFEIGSLSKGVTGLLYHYALERGEVTPETTLGSLLPLEDSAAAGLALHSLATHTSGLPRIPVSSAPRTPWQRTWRWWRYGENPYGDSLEELLAETRDTPLGKPRFSYSNLGFSLLGHAIAAATGSTYARLITERVATPLGMTGTYVAATPDALSPAAITGHSKLGRAHQAWTGDGIAPAGGIRCTAGDVGKLLAALTEGTSPGLAAMEPVASAGYGMRIGAAWMVTDIKGRDVTWHNGRTGGFASCLAVDRQRRTGAAVVTATSASVDGATMGILRGL